jgi:hypothetical protein
MGPSRVIESPSAEDASTKWTRSTKADNHRMTKVHKDMISDEMSNPFITSLLKLTSVQNFSNDQDLLVNHQQHSR